MHSREWKDRLGRNESHEACLSNFMRKFSGIIFLLISIFLIPQLVIAAQIRLAWDPNTEHNLLGYWVYYGTAPWSFDESIKLRKVTSFTLTDLIKGQTYYIAITARDWRKLESGFSNQVYGIAHDVLHGKWVFDISGADKGGAVLRFEDNQNTFRGYGITNHLDFFGVEGTYSVEEDQTISGTYIIYDFQDPVHVLGTGHISGEVGRKGTTVTLDLDVLSLHMKGSLFIEDPYNPQYPDVPEDWALHISGGIKGDIDPLKIEPYPVSGEKYSHLFQFSGSGVTTNLESIDLSGVFLLSSKNYVYGVYEISKDLSDEGFFSGSLNHSLTKLKAKSLSDKGNRYTFTGLATED